MSGDMAQPTGGAFLLEACGSRKIFTPEQFSEEQLMFHKTAVDFLLHEVMPRSKDIENKKEGVVPNLLRKAADVGLLSLEIPEQFGGLGLDVATSMLVAEAISRHGSFSVSLGAHTGIGTLPIVYFGNAKQREKYLPRLNSGELLAAYALTEPTSGSDALGAKTKAVLNKEGTHYVLNGSKQWITNAGFADVFIVFAKVDGEKFTAFIVERKTTGFSIGAEEHKMGIRGSSTCQLTFEDAPVPKENVLGEVGKGHKIAFNILNHGRLKLGVGSNGASKYVLGIAVAYAKSRKAFGQAITNFGLIKEKIGEMGSRIFVAEAMGYRTCGLIDHAHEIIDKADPEADKKRFSALEEFSIESSILKVFGSEVTSYVVDQGVQIHGGYGYSEEYAVERAYRDARINRIFEGTNEINRMLIPGTLLKRAMQGKVLLMDYFSVLQQELEGGKVTPPDAAGYMGKERAVVESLKRVTIYVLQQAAMKYMQDIEKEQEILALIADLCIDVFGMDSAVARAAQMQDSKHALASWAKSATELFIAQAHNRINDGARQVIVEISEGDDRQARLQNLETLTLPYEASIISLRRTLSETIIEKEAYPL
ncbi:MAG: acyl-CoA dehydrogenase family protein [Deltaproteobacteria bacterium]|nr:acyl-CoA dehydrogenase family protein [Deltaproteobacteria bacterium]